MMAGDALAIAEAPLPEQWPLSWLAGRLQVGPPQLQELISGFVDIEVMEKFLKLVRDYLPEHEAEILAEPLRQRVYRFCTLFAKQYYPLPFGAQQNTMANFVIGLPVEILGMSYEQYHDLNFRPGYLLLLSLVIYPYEGEERDMEDDAVPFNPLAMMDNGEKWKPKQSDITWMKELVAGLGPGGKWIAPMGFSVTKVDNWTIQVDHADDNSDVREVVRRTVLLAQQIGLKVNVKAGRTAAEKMVSGARIPLLEMATRLVGKDLVSRIPENGWTPDQLFDATRDTEHDGVWRFANWACQETELTVLDANYENCAIRRRLERAAVQVVPR